MISLSWLLTISHLVGLALGVGAATVKCVLLLRCKADAAYVPIYLKVTKPVTRQIILGQVLLTLSGIGWLLYGYPLTARLVVKIILVGAIWVLGPFIDKVVEPKFQKLAPTLGEPASLAFTRIQKQHLALELVATLLFYVIIVIWVT